MNIKSLAYSILSKIPLSLANNNLRVLAYHTVPELESFRTQLLYLKKRYHIISIFELKEHLFQNKPLPEKSVLITFDDGDYSNYLNAFPVLKMESVPAVFFIITELINSDKTFWCRRVEEIYKKNGRTYQEARDEVNRLKKIPNTERAKVIKEMPSVKSKQLGLTEIRQLENHNIIMGNHTHTHPMINKCTADEICREMNLVKDNFTDWCLEGYPYFAYPNGNFDSNAEKILISKGIKLAFLFDHKLNKTEINPMRISRIRVNADADLNEFKVKVSGLHSTLLSLKNKIIKN